MEVLAVDIDKVNANEGNNFDEDDPYTIIVRSLYYTMSDFCLGIVNLKNATPLKKISEDLMPVAWHPKRR